VAAGLEGFRVGQLRHTGATITLEAGASPLLVAFRLGATSTRMVEQHYAGRLEGFDKEIAKELNAPHAAARMRHVEGSDRATAERLPVTCGNAGSPNGNPYRRSDLRKRRFQRVGMCEHSEGRRPRNLATWRSPGPTPNHSIAVRLREAVPHIQQQV
jgi:hypothetical protein